MSVGGLHLSERVIGERGDGVESGEGDVNRMRLNEHLQSY